MEMMDLAAYAEQYPEQFAKAETFSEFAQTLDSSKPGPGRLLQHVASKYPGTWDRAFRTIKRHGFQARELLLPDATKCADIFADVSLYPMNRGGHYRHACHYVAAGAAFISTIRAADFAYFGHLGARYSKNPKTGCGVIKGGEMYLTAAKPTNAVIEAFGPVGSNGWDLATFEVVRRSSGELLVTAHTHDGFGSRWLCILGAGETVIPMLSEHERGEIAAELENRKAAE